MMPFVLPDGDESVPGLSELVVTVKGGLVDIIPRSALKLLVGFVTALRMTRRTPVIETSVELVNGVGHGIVSVHVISVRSDANDLFTQVTCMD